MISHDQINFSPMLILGVVIILSFSIKKFKTAHIMLVFSVGIE